MRLSQKRNGHQRRARMRGVESESFTADEIFERDRWRCGLCKKRIDKRLKHPHPMSASLDHIIALARGGGHTRSNCQAAHLRCNLRKHAQPGNAQMLLFG